MMLARDDRNAALKRTPLHALHRRRGGKMVPFAGYDMPVQYRHRRAQGTSAYPRRPPACSTSRIWARSRCGAKSGKVEDAALALERLVPQDILAVAPGRQRYAQFTNAAGGILDDLMVANFGDHLFLVVNAACKAEDEAHLRAHLSDSLHHRAARRSRADRAAGTEGRIGAGEALPRSAAMRFMDAGPAPRRRHRLLRLALGLHRRGRFRDFGSGRTGRSACQDAARRIATCCRSGSAPATACGSRPGSASTATTSTPRRRRSRRALEWSIQKSRRHGGARAGGFPGADKILAQLEQGAPRRRVGLRPEGRAPVREGAPLFADATSAEPIGAVTSGGFGPSLNAPVAMGYLPASHAAVGALVFAEVRGQRLPLRVAAMPFVPNTYKR